MSALVIFTFSFGKVSEKNCTNSLIENRGRGGAAIDDRAAASRKLFALYSIIIVVTKEILEY